MGPGGVHWASGLALWCQYALGQCWPELAEAVGKQQCVHSYSSMDLVTGKRRMAVKCPGPLIGAAELGLRKGWGKARAVPFCSLLLPAAWPEGRGGRKENG